MKSHRTCNDINPNNTAEARAKRNAWVERRLVEAAEKDAERYGILLRRFRSGYINLQSVKQRLRIEKFCLINNPVTDLEIIEHLWVSMANGDHSSPTIIRPYTVWTFEYPRVGFGTLEDYDLSADIIFNTLYFFTKQGNLVVDPMAVGGVVGDVCKVMKRKCRMFGVNPFRDDIEEWDMHVQGFPKIGEAADLVFWNPQQQQNDISMIKSTAEGLRDNETKLLAFLISDFFNGHSENNIFFEDYTNIFIRAGWKHAATIQCPLSKSRYSNGQVERARYEQKLLPLARSLVIFENTAALQSQEKEVSA